MSKVLRLLEGSLSRGELLLPRLYAFLARRDGKEDHVAVVQADARMTVKCFTERELEYNHQDPKTKDYFHPSSLGRCNRELWYARQNTPKQPGQPRDGVSLMREHLTFEAGTYIGVLFQNLCERAGYLLQREVPVRSDSAKIIGHADGLLKINAVKYVLEIKTINSRGFTDLRDKPKDAHMRQIHAYMFLMKVWQAVVIYLDKDQGRAKEFVVTFSLSFYQQYVIGRVKALATAIKTGVPPPREGPHSKAFPCTYCPYAQTCFGLKAPATLFSGEQIPATVKATLLKQKYQAPPPLELKTS